MNQNFEILTEIKTTLERQKKRDDARIRIIESEQNFRRISEELTVYERLVHGCFEESFREKTPPVMETKRSQNPVKKTPTHPINSILPNTFMNLEAENPNTENSLDVQWESLADEINSETDEVGKKVSTIIRSVRFKNPI